MARFAWDCLLKFSDLTKQLEMSLGPDTTDLGIRFGVSMKYTLSASSTRYTDADARTSFDLLI